MKIRHRHSVIVMLKVSLQVLYLRCRGPSYCMHVSVSVLQFTALENTSNPSPWISPACLILCVSVPGVLENLHNLARNVKGNLSERSRQRGPLRPVQTCSVISLESDKGSTSLCCETVIIHRYQSNLYNVDN